jgi:hypothetical protein
MHCLCVKMRKALATKNFFFEIFSLFRPKFNLSWGHGLHSGIVFASNKEIGAVGREIESPQGICSMVVLYLPTYMRFFQISLAMLKECYNDILGGLNVTITIF